jgi:hypothetical protein
MTASRELAGTAAAALTTLLLAAAPALGATNNILPSAGTGTPGYNGDGLPAGSAQLAAPIFVAATPGGYLIADQGNCRVRSVGIGGGIATVAGNGTCGFGGDGGPATGAQLSSAITDVELMPGGGFLIADANNNRVRRVFGDGHIDTVAGTAAGAGYNGDGIPATTAQLSFPDGLAVRADGSYLIADNDNFRIRNVAADGTISTVAGTGAPGAGGDSGPATSAQLNGPGDVELMADGGFILADTDNNRVRRVIPGGTIVNVAGDGTAAFGGDGGPAGIAQLNGPIGLAVLADGGVLIADRLNNRIRRVGTDGQINTVAGNGTAGSLGDGGPAVAAELNQPFGVSVNAEGDYIVADTLNHRVRIVDAGDPPPAPAPEPKKTANVELKSGTVLVKCPGQSESKLDGEQQIKLGCRVDASDGVVTLTAAADTKGKTQSADFYEGAFKPKQVEETQLVKKKKTKVLVTELTLDVAKPSGCKKTSKTSVGAAKRGGHLWGRGKGRYRTRGRRGSGAVRGTEWLTEERCEGTYFKVKSGVVEVRDFTLKRTVLVKKGKSYLAPAKRPAK